ncbi:hypothetical protein EB796_022334 [Bugula neritina]|uniref:Uncharacterized protein n=1 Tax=Bugula neritina TaxID=10212 RepID=A0A7J7J0L3_BUGNE|nr:hypothetical protein EB796_022334 [Bugula neritina]
MSHFYIAANPTPSVPECPAGLSSHTDPFGCAFTHMFINIDDSCPNIPKDERDCRDQKCGGPGVYWVLKGSEERIPKEMCCEIRLYARINVRIKIVSFLHWLKLELIASKLKPKPW